MPKGMVAIDGQNPFVLMEYDRRLVRLFLYSRFHPVIYERNGEVATLSLLRDVTRLPLRDAQPDHSQLVGAS